MSWIRLQNRIKLLNSESIRDKNHLVYDAQMLYIRKILISLLDKHQRIQSDPDLGVTDVFEIILVPDTNIKTEVIEKVIPEIQRTLIGTGKFKVIRSGNRQKRRNGLHLQKKCILKSYPQVCAKKGLQHSLAEIIGIA
jgi:hypothetical protein